MIYLVAHYGHPMNFWEALVMLAVIIFLGFMSWISLRPWR